MARSLPPYTWKNGYAVPAGEGATAPWADEKHFSDETGERAHYRLPVEGEKLTSTVGNSFGIAQLRSWPDVYNGTEAGQEKPAWWKPETEVDVLICGGR